ncbi:uncharacterized protein LOC123014462 [Tribolium madens]|uniref:uncharacterized protein LOC123014462 n=1 Tax=Tribolium madens TaxID=41895 RepID=UPI001CF754F6|nr:uncharacterized protein LOC123014462 [Tribolium madens]
MEYAYMDETLANIHLNKQQQNRRERNGGNLPKVSSTTTVFQLKQENVKRTGSFVVGQKLRESKWFTHAEMSVFCAVVESGFIVEQKENDVSKYGVAIWAPNYEKSKNPEYLTIYTITENKGKFKVLPCKLVEFWPEGTCVKINNKCDKTETPLPEDTVRNQILAAENSKRKWHNTEHFAYYCRYGPVATNVRMRKITDQLRLNTGGFFLKIRSLTAK